MTVLKPGSLNDIYAPIQPELDGFSRLLKEELSSEDPLIQDIHTHLLKMTGKFLRPALAIFSSHVEGQPREDVLRLGVAIELIHTATLVHDDIIDNSELRRNQPSVHTKWGREISIVAGDYLYAKAFILFASFADPWINQAFARCAQIMCEGEMKQIERRNHFLLGEKEYLKIIHQKTASLFQAACMGGSYLSGAGTDTVEKMGEYGFGLGMAFQIVDDCLDLVGETETLGKTPGLDLLKNDVTLPMLHFFQALEPAEREALIARMQNNEDGIFETIRRSAVEKKAIEKSMAKAREYSQRALDALSGVKASVYRDHLTALVHHCMDRVR